MIAILNRNQNEKGNMAKRRVILMVLLILASTFAHAGEPMRVEKVPAFYVIGKLGQGSIENKNAWIPPLWAAASGTVTEIADHIKRASTGEPAGVWAIMSDRSESFKPWDTTGGKYLAGYEAVDESSAPEGWTKWRVPGYEYIVIETSLAKYEEAFTHTITTLLPEKELTLVGAVHERYPSPDDPSIVELYFPIQHLTGPTIH